MSYINPSNLKIKTTRNGKQIISTKEFDYHLPPKVRAYLYPHKQKGYLLVLNYAGMVKRHNKYTKLIGGVKVLIEKFIDEVLVVEDIYDSKLCPTKAFGNNQTPSECFRPYYLLREGDYDYAYVYRLYCIKTGKSKFISKKRLLELANKHNTDIYGYVDILFKRFLETKLTKEDLLSRFIFK